MFLGSAWLVTFKKTKLIASSEHILCMFFNCQLVCGIGIGICMDIDIGIDIGIGIGIGSGSGHGSGSGSGFGSDLLLVFCFGYIILFYNIM